MFARTIVLVAAVFAAQDDPGPTGPLTEEAFKALHELSDAEVPPPRGREITLASGGKAYLSLPATATPSPANGSKAPLPAILVIHEWWGLNRHIRHWTDRLAADGYAALAVDLYEGTVAENRDDAMKAMQSVDEAKALAHLQAAAKFLKENEAVRAPKLATLGWCFGGAWSLRCAQELDGLDAAVIYYGRLVTDPAKLEGIDAELLGVFGNQDGSIPPDVVDAFDQALTEAGVTHTIHRYDAAHAFANPSAANYDEKSAADAWEKVRAFLSRTLKDGAAPASDG